MATYGISSSFWPGTDFAAALSLAAGAGFREMEIVFADKPPGDAYQDPAGTRRLLDDAGVVVRSVHSHTRGWNNGAPDPADRAASVQKTVDSLHVAAELGARVVVVHSNNAGSPEIYVDEKIEENRRLSMDSLATIADAAAKAGMLMAVENLPARHLARPGTAMADVLAMIDGLGDHVGVCLDAGHAHANGEVPADVARLAGSKVLAVHIQDCDGLGEDQHLAPGEGTVDWAALWAALDQVAPDCVRTFEVSSKDRDQEALLQALAQLRAEREG